MYKNKAKQREANRQAKMRQREREGMTITLDNVIPTVIPERTAKGNIRVSKPGDADYGLQCKTKICKYCGKQLEYGVLECCYECALKPSKRPLVARNTYVPKRGKDIKTFEDLPPDVQETIDKMSAVDGKIDQTIKANRTAIAINYQYLYPDRYHSTGAAL